MGKAGRLACVTAPMLLLAACFACQIFVFLGQMNRDVSLLNDLYFLKADTKEFNRDPLANIPDVPGTDADNRLIQALKDAAQANDMKDFYQIGLWNYCEGTRDDSGNEIVTYCSPRKASFWFDPIEVWDMKGVNESDVFNQEMKDGIAAYRKVVKFAFAAWIISIVLTVAECVVCMFAILSRWGSLATTIISGVKNLFLIAAAGSTTAVYAALAGVFHTVLDPLNIKSQLGARMFSVVWLAVAFGVASGLFWMVSSCCCSGKSSSGKRVSAEKAPYTYERVASPYMGAAPGSHTTGTVPSGNHAPVGHNAYEPYRQV
ncbi:integral membrane protein-like protein [Sporormia fimetaria CBS 119925]|uniref:Integral membrane protein-like protein n=1 Tax=Sporormia fimetaria CBS 119925 TaxID=1340428 RepID=A0A6A6VBI2_9PLEO|nr:integral membrane protein-like protein [Sporormia fimetaria CBS 119925]